MKRIYIDTSDNGEARQEKLNDNVIVGYDKDGEIVGVEIINPTGIDIDDEKVVSYETESYQFNPNDRWGIA